MGLRMKNFDIIGRVSLKNQIFKGKGSRETNIQGGGELSKKESLSLEI